MAASGPIALFDSGEGGLTVLRQLAVNFPGEQFLYAADSAHFPYGEKTLDQVRAWFLRFLDFFERQHARAVVIACNTATAAALDEAQRLASVPVLGVVTPAAERAAAVTRNGRIAVLSTEATYRSGLYPAQLRTINPDLAIVAKPCPILVVMAENGQVAGKDVEDEVRQCVLPILDTGVDTVILGCTHFPHMRQVFNRVVASRARIVDPGEEIARRLSHVASPATKATPQVEAWTTGDPDRFSEIAHRLCPDLPISTRALRWKQGSLEMLRQSSLDTTPD